MGIGLVIFFLVACYLIYKVSCISYVHSEKKRLSEEYWKLKRKEGIKTSGTICIQDGSRRIMLRKDFIEREWNKTGKGGMPIRGEYESAAHFLKRVDEYRKMKAEQKRRYDEELARKKQNILGRCEKAPLSKSEYEADEILKKYNGEL